MNIEQTTLDEYDPAVNYLFYDSKEDYKKNGKNYAETVFRVRPWVNQVYHMLKREVLHITRRD